RTFLDLAPEKLQEEKVDLEELRNPNFWRDFYTHVQKQIQRITELLTHLGVATAQPDSRFEDAIGLHGLPKQGLPLIRTRTADKTVTVENLIPTDLPALHGDRHKMARFFELLLKDEVLNLPNGGKVEFRASQGTQENAPVLHLEIKDNGPGLAGDS